MENTTTELLKMANRDYHGGILYGPIAQHMLQVANQHMQAEDGRPESDWAPVTAIIIQDCVRQAYRRNGQ